MSESFGNYLTRTIIYYHLTVITVIPSKTDLHISKFSNKKIMIKERDTHTYIYIYIYIYRKRGISKLYDKSGFTALVDYVVASATPW